MTVQSVTTTAVPVAPAAAAAARQVTRTLDHSVAADLQAYFEAELERAYRSGYADAQASRPPDDATLVRGDIVRAVEDVLADIPTAAFPGRAAVEVHDRHGTCWTFHRASPLVRPDFPTLIRIEASRPLTAAEVTRLRDLTAYAYRATVRGDSVGAAYVDSPYSFVVPADTSTSKRTNPMVALDDFEHRLADWLLHGSPIRSTDKAGHGTGGTRAVAGLADPALRVAVYYDRTILGP